MSWKCHLCGAENTGPKNHCLVCNDTRFGELSLIAEETNKRIRISIDTVIGKRLLRTFAGNDSAYASDEQFVVHKDKGLAKWAIRHSVEAKNPTFLCGKQVSDRSEGLDDGAVISIGRKRMKLIVKIDH